GFINRHELRSRFSIHYSTDQADRETLAAILASTGSQIGRYGHTVRSRSRAATAGSAAAIIRYRFSSHVGLASAT
ncbi:MAG: hypothetical protein ACKOOG_11830, partial [Actinomycetota bacterium]